MTSTHIWKPVETFDMLVRDLTIMKQVSTPLLSDSNESAVRFVQAAEKNMIAGGIAGCVGKTLTAPLSRLTVLYQVGPLLNQSRAAASTIRVRDSLWSTIRSIVRQEGVRSLWKGNLTSVIHRFPYSASNFASFELCKDTLNKHASGLEPSWARLISGAVSGATSCFVCYPLDIVRTRLTVGIDHNPSTAQKSSSKILQILISILETEGVRGVYRGLGASLAVAVPTYAVSFSVYGKMKEFLLRKGFVNPSSGHLSPAGALMSGSVSGVVSSILIFPLDVVRKRLQIAGIIPPQGTSVGDIGANRSIGVFRQIALIYGTEGLRGFYRGIMAEVLKVCPMVAVTFCSFELIKDILDSVAP